MMNRKSTKVSARTIYIFLTEADKMTIHLQSSEVV